MYMDRYVHTEMFLVYFTMFTQTHTHRFVLYIYILYTNYCMLICQDRGKGCDSPGMNDIASNAGHDTFSSAEGPNCG